jgi:hypothetical protein
MGLCINLNTERERLAGILARILPRARSASTAGRRSPSMRASIIARPDLVAMLEATESILIPSWSTLPSRWTSRVRDCTTLVLYRMTSRAALMSAGGMKLPRSSPHSSRSSRRGLRAALGRHRPGNRDAQGHGLPGG